MTASPGASSRQTVVLGGSIVTVMNAIILAEKLTKQFGNLKAVESMDFSVDGGEVIGFVGANGSGKSTTINMLLGFISPTEGSAQLFGEIVTPQSAHRSHWRIGYAAGDMQLPASLTARQYLKFLTHQYGSIDAKRLEQLSQRFQPVLDKKISTLSRGNKQKIALIAAFISNPDLVILDEPTSGLDPVMQEAFLDLVRDESARGTTIFMSSHYLNEVADVCSRIILMRHGKVISDTPAHQLLAASGKRVRIVTGYARTTIPRGAESVEKIKNDDGLVLSFDWRREPAELQQWLAGVKQLRDIEISEFNLEAAFRDMYDTEEKVL